MYVISYDIQSAKVRRRVVKVLSGLGHRVQKSVWETRAEAERVAAARARIQRLLQPGDSLRTYRLCAGCYAALQCDGPGGPAYGETILAL